MTMQAQRGGRDIAATHPQPGCRGRWVVSTTLRSSYHQEIPVVHCTGGWVSLGADPRIVQAAASRYTDYALPATYVQ
jgi:hypothetical protein